MSKTVEELIEEQIARWSGAARPNEACREFAKGFESVIEGFERLRGTFEFQDEPSIYLAALQETKERET